MLKRSTALDALRGGLVALMIIYHACYMADMFSIVDIELYEGLWWLFPRGIAAGFVAVSGWCLAAKKARGAGFSAFARRAGRLALPAVAVSAVSLALFGVQGVVFFGVLHLVALSAILAWPLLGRPALAATAGAFVLVGGLLLGRHSFPFPWLAWLGLRPEGLYPVDYLPLLPWFAYTAFGAAAFDIVARMRATRPVRSGETSQAPSRRSPAPVRALAFLGRHSLAVYLIHLPTLYGLAWLVARIVGRA